MDANAVLQPSGGLPVTLSLFNRAPIGKALLLVSIVEV